MRPLCLSMSLVIGLSASTVLGEDPGEAMERGLAQARDQVPARTAEAAAAVPGSAFFDSGLSSFTATDNAGRINFWELFNLLASPDTFSDDEGGQFKFSVSPTRHFNFAATFAQPTLRDGVRDAFDDQEEEAALDKLTLVDDVTAEVSFNLTPGEKGGAPKLIAQYVALVMEQPAFRAQVEDTAAALDRLERGTPEGRAYAAARQEKLALEDLEFEQRQRLKVLKHAADSLEGRTPAEADAFIKAEIEATRADANDPDDPLVTRTIDEWRAARALLASREDEDELREFLSGEIETLEGLYAETRRRFDEVLIRAAVAAEPFYKLAEQVPFTAVDDLIQDTLVPLYRAYRNRPTGRITARYRAVDDLLGQEGFGLSANLQWGHPRVPRKVKTRAALERWMQKRAGDLGGKSHSFSLQASWVEREEIRFPTRPELDADGFQEVSGSFNWTTKVFENQLQDRPRGAGASGARPVGIGADQSLTVTYTRPNEDFANERITVNETFTLHIPDAPFSIPISITWANREELIDEDVVRGFIGFSYNFQNKNEVKP